MKTTVIFSVLFLLLSFASHVQVSIQDYNVFFGEKKADKHTLLHLGSTTDLRIRAALKPFSKCEVAVCAKINNVFRPLSVEQIFPETEKLILNPTFYLKNKAESGCWLVIRVYDEQSVRVEGQFEYQIVE